MQSHKPANTRAAETTLVLLPGLDGTATMFSAFTEAVRPYFSTVVAVPYPHDRALDYAALAAVARSRVPDDAPFVLLGESFSGPVALSIAADPPPGLVGLVLSTTFSRSPLPLLSPFAPLTALAPAHGLPGRLLSWWLLGRWATPELQTSLQAALASVAPSVLRSRAAAALRADVSDKLEAIAAPILYLRATHDRLLSSAAGDRIVAAAPRARLVDVPGPHLLLQTAPESCARAIAEFAARLER